MRILSFLAVSRHSLPMPAISRSLTRTQSVEVFLPPPLRSRNSLGLQQSSDGRDGDLLRDRRAGGLAVKRAAADRLCQRNQCIAASWSRFRRATRGFVSDQALAWSNPYLTTGPCITLLMDRLKAAIQLKSAKLLFSCWAMLSPTNWVTFSKASATLGFRADEGAVVDRTKSGR